MRVILVANESECSWSGSGSGSQPWEGGGEKAFGQVVGKKIYELSTFSRESGGSGACPHTSIIIICILLPYELTFFTLPASQLTVCTVSAVV